MLSALFLCKKEHKMERYTTNTMTVERKGVFDKSRKKRFELTFTCKDSRQKKSILVIGLNPASDDISIIGIKAWI